MRGSIKMTRHSRTLNIFKLAVLNLLLTTALVAGESGPVDEDALKKAWPSDGPIGELFHDVAGSLRCPTCTGLSVLESDARFSQQIKEIVLEQVEAGKNRDQILQYFTERYGPWILRSPPPRGFNVLAWLLPLTILLLGPPAVWFFVWRKRRVMNTLGVRSSDDIIKEMQGRLKEMQA
jgi:cytochrome c-type biogenesis protein CcmH